MKTLAFVFAFSLVLVGCAQPPVAIAACTIRNDADVADIAADAARSCPFLDIEHPTLANLDALSGRTDIGVLTIRNTPQLERAVEFIEAQSQLAALVVLASPIGESITIASPIFESLSLEDTNVKDVTLASTRFDNLSLLNVGLESLNVATVASLRIEGAETSSLEVFAAITSLKGLVIRSTVLTVAAIDAFAAQQTEPPVVEHCNNADDAPCETAVPLTPG
jgi:hypothetical protein